MSGAPNSYGAPPGPALSTTTQYGGSNTYGSSATAPPAVSKPPTSGNPFDMF